VDPTFTTREDVDACVATLCERMDIKPVRLMDFLSPNERTQRCVEHEHTLANDLEGGLAILQVPLTHVNELREHLQHSEALSLHGMMSLSTSGKIRLVRERLGIPKPRRRR
jgi:hypothetical protein